MTELRDFIDSCHRTAVEKSFYEETQRRELPNDILQLLALVSELRHLAVRGNIQRKSKMYVDERGGWHGIRDSYWDNWGDTSVFTPRDAHIIRQLIHMAVEIGEFLKGWRENKGQVIDYEEFADIFIVWADIAGFIGTDKVVKAVEQKMKKNEGREIGYGRAEDLGFVDLTNAPGVVEELTGKAPTFDELAKTWAEQAYVTEEKMPEMNDEDVKKAEEKESHKKPEEPQEETFRKVFGDSMRQSLQGGDTIPLEKSDDGISKLSK